MSNNDLTLTKELADLHMQIDQSGFYFAPAERMQGWLGAGASEAMSDWPAFAASWDDMPLDQYMADGGRYRRRRYATLSAAAGDSKVKLEPHQPHYQSLDYNALNGGIAREYEPITEAVMLGNTMQSILHFCLRVFGQMMPDAAWHIECHQFRIEANTGEHGQPTPEGVHRDGVDFVLVMMVKRVNISSGTTTMHDLEQRKLDSFTLTQPFDSAIVNDRRCMHGVTPVEQIDPAKPAYRDVLVITFRNSK